MRNAEKKKKVGQNVLNSEVGPGVVLLVAELCRGYRCGSRKKRKAERKEPSVLNSACDELPSTCSGSELVQGGRVEIGKKGTQSNFL
jgi:hypothetical protein